MKENINWRVRVQYLVKRREIIPVDSSENVIEKIQVHREALVFGSLRKDLQLPGGKKRKRFSFR